jgi:hypothetical protein
VIRTTNLLERLFLEERRRTKIIPHAFGERPVSKRMYAAVIRAAGQQDRKRRLRCDGALRISRSGVTPLFAAPSKRKNVVSVRSPYPRF